METENWRQFFKQTYAFLASYDIQRDPSLYNLCDLSDWSQKNKSKFLSILQDNNIDTAKINITEMQYRHLTALLDSTLRQRPSKLCQNQAKLSIRGDFVKLSEIPLDFCHPIKNLEIFSSHTIFIDDDFTSTDPEFTLTMAAPTWVVIGERTITLDGQDGAPPDPPKAPPGADGHPGLPGKSGGGFFGIAQTVVHGKNLTITSKGGRGGMGQEGGDGPPGRDGRNATLAKFDSLRHEKIGNVRWRIFGEDGEKGGRGGHGGKGGLGGSPGLVKVLHLGDGEVDVRKERGEEGAYGRGGRGGPGGKNGSGLDATYIICCWSGEEEVKNDDFGPRGDDGENGFNVEGMVQPEDAKGEDFRNVLSEYKVFLRGYLRENPYRKEETKEFLTRLDLSDFLDVEGIFNDYKMLEEQFRRYPDHLNDLLPFYDNLLKAVERKSQLQHSEDEKILLLHLYTTLLSKLDIIDEDLTHSDLVVKLKMFLDVRIHHYRNLQRYGPDRIINDFRRRRSHDIDGLIEHIKAFIEKHGKNFQTGDQILDQLLTTIGTVLVRFGDAATRLNKITTSSNHIPKFLHLENSSQAKVSRDEISALESTLDSINATTLDLDVEESKYVDKKHVEKMKNQTLQVLQRMKDDINHFKNGVVTTLDVTKWNIRDYLKCVKYSVKKLPEDFTSISLEGLNHMIDIYRRVENYYRLVKLSQHLSTFDSNNWTSELENSTFSSRLSKLKDDTVANLIISHYENSVNLFRQAAFPLFDKIVDEYRLVPAMVINSNNATALLHRCIDYTKLLQGALDSNTNQMFSTTYNRQSSFIWRNSDHRASFEKLFSGEEIVLFADPKLDHREGVHFQWIEINFKAVNESNQEMIDDLLNDFELSLTHMGNSYYKCGNKSYLYTTSPSCLSYGFKRSRTAGEEYRRVRQNAVYVKIHQGDPILSPFAVWILQLEELVSGRKTFRDLRFFPSLVDLHLDAKETYFEKGEACGGDVDGYYDVDEPFPQPRFCASAASSFRSPINGLFGWVSSSLVSVARIDYLGSFALGSDVTSEATLQPVPFFYRVNSLLVLVPLLLCVGKSYFCQKRGREERRKSRIEKSRSKIWSCFCGSLKNILVKYDLTDTWMSTALEDLDEEIDLHLDSEVFETKLVATLVDFVDGVRYDHAFRKVKGDVNFIGEVDRLIRVAEKIPRFANKLVMK